MSELNSNSPPVKRCNFDNNDTNQVFFLLFIITIKLFYNFYLIKNFF